MSKEMIKPESNSDVLNKHPKTLIIGYGWVGQYIGSYFKEGDYTTIENSINRVKDNTPSDNEKWELLFVCVPSPMLPSGKCDTSIVEEVIKKYKDAAEYFCIKSTVEVGTIDYLKKKYGVKICMSPEYVGETLGHPLAEPTRDPFIILGGEKETTKKFAEAWTLVTNSYTKIYQVSAKTAELCKLMENSFISTKVMFMNEFFSLAEEVGVDFNELREVFLADPRVSRSHTYVYRKNRGFSGKCLPKDLNNLVWFYKNKTKTRAELIEFLLNYNKKLRDKHGAKGSIPLLPYKDKKKT